MNDACKSLKPRWRAILVLLGAFGLSGCSSEYKVLVQVTPDGSKQENMQSQVLVIIAEAPHSPNDLARLTAQPLEDNGELHALVCCVPQQKIWIYAFEDTNHSGTYDVNERLVADSKNPIVLNGDYTSQLRL